jgi:hypothetical protein
VVIAEIGLDMGVFPTPGHLVSWSKLSPRTIQSGAKNQSGRTGKGNPYLKGVLGEAAAAAGRTDTFLGERYRRIARRRGKLRALVAVARSILVIAWHLLADPAARFRELGAGYYAGRIDKNRKTRAPRVVRCGGRICADRMSAAPPARRQVRRSRQGPHGVGRVAAALTTCSRPVRACPGIRWLPGRRRRRRKPGQWDDRPVPRLAHRRSAGPHRPRGRRRYLASGSSWCTGGERVLSRPGPSSSGTSRACVWAFLVRPARGVGRRGRDGGDAGRGLGPDQQDGAGGVVDRAWVAVASTQAGQLPSTIQAITVTGISLRWRAAKPTGPAPPGSGRQARKPTSAGAANTALALLSRAAPSRAARAGQRP